VDTGLQVGDLISAGRVRLRFADAAGLLIGCGYHGVGDGAPALIGHAPCERAIKELGMACRAGEAQKTDDERKGNGFASPVEYFRTPTIRVKHWFPPLRTLMLESPKTRCQYTPAERRRLAELAR